MTGFLALLRFVALRHIVSSPVRSLLTTLGVALGVAMVVGMSASNDAVLSAFDAMVDRTAGKADLEVTGDGAGVSQDIVDDLAARTDIVAHVAGRIEQTSYLEGEGGKPGTRVLVLGVDFLGDKEFLPFTTDSGDDVIADPIAFLNDPDAILVTDTLAAQKGLKPGSELKLRTAQAMQTFHVAAVLKETGKTRAFGGQMVVLFLDAAQLAFQRERRVDRVDVKAAVGVATERARADLQQIVGSRGTVAAPGKRAGQIAKMSGSFRAGLQALATISVFVGMFLIFNAVGVSVAERRREIGTLRCLGVVRSRITSLFLAEAVVMGAVGGAVGVLFGGGLARAVVAQLAPTISQIYEPIAAPVPKVTWPLALVGLAVGVGATVLASWVPARRASFTSPIEALRRDTPTTLHARPAILRLLAGSIACALAAAAVGASHLSFAGVLAIGLIFAAGVLLTPVVVATLTPLVARAVHVVFGRAAALGVENLTRDFGRTVLTVSGLMLAAAMSITVAGYSFSYETSCLTWVEQSIMADVVVTAGSPLLDHTAVSFSADVAKQLAGVPGIEDVDHLRNNTVDVRDKRIQLLSLNTKLYLTHLARQPFHRVIDGPEPLPADVLTREPSVFISENFSRYTGLRAGDMLDLPSPTGVHAVRIVAVIVDYTSDQGLILIDRTYATQYWQDDRVDALDVYVERGADPVTVAASVRDRLARTQSEGNGLFVVTNAALKGEVRHALAQVFGVSKASELIALWISVLGIIGMMLAAVIDRTREIGVLRAIGATRRQIVASVVAEAGTLGFFAAIVAVMVAVPAGMIFVDAIGVQATGWRVPFQLPTASIVRIVVSVVVVAAVSGLLPGFKAARLQVIRALAHE